MDSMEIVWNPELMKLSNVGKSFPNQWFGSALELT